MNLLQLTLKQMRQRLLSTVLTVVGVALATTLAVVLLVTAREAENLVSQQDFGYDLVVGDRGSKLQLVLNMVFGLDQPPGLVGWDVVEDLQTGEFARFTAWAVPVAATDSLEGFPVLATTPQILGYADDGETLLPEAERFAYRQGRTLELAEGTAFANNRFEAVLGADVAATLGLGLGDRFQVTHGLVEAGEDGDVHGEEWTVVGVLVPTGTAFDDYALQSIVSSLSLGSHGDVVKIVTELRERGEPVPEMRTYPEVLAAGGSDFEYYVLGPDGTIHLKLPRAFWKVSGVYVSASSSFNAATLAWNLNNGQRAMAARPAEEMIAFFGRFVRPIVTLLFWITVLVTVVAATSILVSIYNSMAARRREIAVLRSLGATRGRILGMVTLEALLLGLAGALLGWLLGHVLAAAVGSFVEETAGSGIDAWRVDRTEALYVAGVVALATLAGLVPAWRAYRVPVAQNLAE